MYKTIKELIVYPICNLINGSFSTGVFPDSLKYANITPILKSGSPQEVSNYRPISVLSTLSKIFEKAISNRLLKFIHKYSIISEKQFGFLKNRSTADAIYNLIEHIYSALNNKQYSISVFIDLRKAFDTVNKDILLRKLSRYGIRGLPLKLLSSYMSERKQCVRIGSVKSNFSTVNIGVPQGSILGPLLFILYINDLPLVPNNLSTILYADDTTIYGSSMDDAALTDRFNIELNKVYQYTCVNRLSLNVAKTYAILFSNRSMSDASSRVKLSDQYIEFVESGKFLGVTIDNKLSFAHHIGNVCSKLSRTIGVFYKLRHDIPRDNLIRLYYSLFYPYLLYCNVIWGGTYQSHLEPIIKLQKKVIRIIMGEHYLAHTCNLFFQAKILKFSDLHRFLVCNHMYKNLNQYINLNNHVYSTRNRDNIAPMFQRLSLTQHSVSYSGPHIWNSLPENLKNIQSFPTFKRELKLYFVNLYTH